MILAIWKLEDTMDDDLKDLLDLNRDDKLVKKVEQAINSLDAANFWEA